MSSSKLISLLALDKSREKRAFHWDMKNERFPALVIWTSQRLTTYKGKFTTLGEWSLSESGGTPTIVKMWKWKFHRTFERLESRKNFQLPAKHTELSSCDFQAGYKKKWKATIMRKTKGRDEEPRRTADAPIDGCRKIFNLIVLE